jgi:hypothetical protein
VEEAEMRTVIIAASGKWELMPVGDQTLLQRTIGQFTKYADNIYVVSPSEAVRYSYKHSFIPVRGSRTLYEVFLGSHCLGLWGKSGTTVLVTGNILWFDRGMHKLFEDNPSPCFLGNFSECPVITFKPENHNEMRLALELTNLDRAQCKWPLVRNYLGIPFDEEFLGCGWDRCVSLPGTTLEITDEESYERAKFRVKVDET